MRVAAISFALVLVTSGCSDRPQSAAPSTTATLPPRLNSYFEQYCDYTGGMGIGFDASQTYDFRFRQHLKATQDPELKRLFVLQHLHRDVEFALRDFEQGILRTGKSSTRPLTPPEWRDTREAIESRIDDLATYYAFTNFATRYRDPLASHDPTLDSNRVEELRGDLRRISNAPTASEGDSANRPTDGRLGDRL